MVLLEYKMKVKGLSVEDVCKQLNIDKSTFYRKKKGESDFHRKEIQQLKKILDLKSEELDNIFFDK